MRFVRERLLDAFNSLDEATASRHMATMLAIYPIEQICIELMTPTLWEIGRLWEQGLIPVAIEHFASCGGYFRYPSPNKPFENIFSCFSLLADETVKE